MGPKVIQKGVRIETFQFSKNSEKPQEKQRFLMIQGSKNAPKIDTEASKMKTKNSLHFFIDFYRFLGPFWDPLGVKNGSKIDLIFVLKI